MKGDFLLSLEQKERFEELYKVYWKSMLRYAYSLIRDEAAAEDIVQEVFIKVAGCMDQIMDMQGSHIQNFLFTIVKNCSIDYIRKMKKEWKQICSLDEDIVLVDEEDILEDICKGENRELLYAAIDKLKKAYQDVLLMKYVQEMSDEEIASELKISADNVRIRIFRARKALSKVIKQDRG